MPVLSEQILLAPPIISQEDNLFTKFWSSSIRPTENERDIITAKGRPSGTATTMITTPTIKYPSQSLMYFKKRPVHSLPASPHFTSAYPAVEDIKRLIASLVELMLIVELLSINKLESF